MRNFYMGIDYSMTSPAIATWSDNGISKTRFVTCDCSFHFLTNKKYLQDSWGCIHGKPMIEYKTREERYEFISQWVLDIVDFFDPTAIFIEGYSMGSRSGKILNVAENGGVLRNKLFTSDREFYEVPPKTIKKFATGNGNAGKDEMWDCFREETGQNFNERLGLKTNSKKANPVSDMIDAYYILKYGVKEIMKIDRKW